MEKISSYLCGVWSDIASVPRLTYESAREMRDVRSLAGSSMLTALSVVLNQFTIFFTQVLRLSVTFLPVAMCAMLYGPLLTGAMGAAVDILKYFTRNDGSAFFPGFTISEFMRGFLYGVFFYRRRVTLPRVAAAHLSVVVIVTLVLNPLWLSIMFGDAFIALVSMRLVKNIVMFPIEVGLLYFLLKKTGEIYSRARSSGYYAKKSQ